MMKSFYLGAVALVLSSSLGDSDIARDCKSFCDQYSEGACTRHGGDFKCLRGELVNSCSMLFWTDSAKTKICIDVEGGGCVHSAMKIPVECGGNPSTVTTAPCPTTTPAPCPTTTPAPCPTTTPAPCPTTTPAPCPTTTTTPAPCPTTTTTPAPCPTTTTTPAPCPTTTTTPGPCPTTTPQPEPVVDECKFNNKLYECREDRVPPICRGLYWTDSTFKHMCFDEGDGKCGYGKANRPVRCKGTTPPTPYKPRNSCDVFCNEHGNNLCAKEGYHIECRRDNHVCRGLYTDRYRSGICLDPIDQNCGASPFSVPVSC
ncbi:hypothetical protein FOL47_006412 [Perkinsus chesapeaki]|uniref:Uncharacterized protein n=1 Tax=Perkinsus chesapeaki TaxID=330153 RepID=A0A7J6LRX9_PERCH|nr:hypothetical protein FOL47_006412 [Perkinsus chesapeaki]